MHYASQCPHANSKQSANVTEEEEDLCEEVELVLMSSHDQEVDKQEVFVAEARTSAVVDTACTKTVAGDNWLDGYVRCLPEGEEKSIEYLDSNTTFKFGDGRKARTIKKAIFPAIIANRRCKIVRLFLKIFLYF